MQTIKLSDSASITPILGGCRCVSRSDADRGLKGGSESKPGSLSALETSPVGGRCLGFDLLFASRESEEIKSRHDQRSKSGR